MELDLPAAVVAGALGATVMMTTRVLMKLAVPLRMDVIRIWGTLLGFHGPSARAVGVVVHVVVSVVIAVLYALGFDLLGADDALWAWGLFGGLIHWAIAGVMMVVLPVAHPEMPEEREAPGAFIRHFGRPDIIGFLVGHLAFGAAVGILYAWLGTGLDHAF